MIAVENSFLDIGQVKNAIELIVELESINSHNRDVNSLIKKNLLDLLDKIKSSNLVT